MTTLDFVPRMGRMVHIKIHWISGFACLHLSFLRLSVTYVDVSTFIDKRGRDQQREPRDVLDTYF